jgi:mono/diheme cytochrome c family protein
MTGRPPAVPKELRALRSRVAVVGATIGALLVLGIGGTAAFVASGLYDISVTSQHTQPVYTLLEVIGRRSIQLRARHIDAPDLSGPVLVQRGATCYRDKCLQCHGGPGVAQNEIGLSMQPLPGPLVDAAARWKPRELYWITQHGIKMSGMPAWQYRLSEQDLWAVVAFLERLPQHTPRTFKAAMAEAPGECRKEASDETSVRPPSLPPDAGRGRLALHQHACTACHVIPGIAGADVQVGPPLTGFANRRLIAGSVPNTEERLVQWIRDPQRIDPETAMPALGVSEADARDMAVYLRTLR